jgi:hypothetical protein
MVLLGGRERVNIAVWGKAGWLREVSWSSACHCSLRTVHLGSAAATRDPAALATLVLAAVCTLARVVALTPGQVAASTQVLAVDCMRGQGEECTQGLAGDCIRALEAACTPDQAGAFTQDRPPMMDIRDLGARASLE